MNLIRTLFLAIPLLVVMSCNSDDESIAPSIVETDASSYIFARNDISSVDINEQMDMAQMLATITDYAEEAYAGVIVEANVFRAGFENINNNGGGLFSFESNAALERNVMPMDLSDDYFGDIFEQAAIASKSGNQAAEFTPGLILRASTDTNASVNNLGQEFAQFIEKGVMGSIFLHQILNVHLSDEFAGDDVNNDTLVLGKNYTELEHNWDIAFGYFTAPGDLTSTWPSARANELQYWSSYSNLLDPLLGSNDKIMDAFRDGRDAIANGNLELKNNSRDILYTELELLSAATAIHYINLSSRYLSEDKQGDLLYSLSAAYMFARALNMNPRKKIFPSQLHNILNVDFGLGGNLWSVTPEGLETAKAKLVDFYPSLADVKDEL